MVFLISSCFTTGTSFGAATAVVSIQSAVAGSVHANILMSGMTGAVDGEKNVPLSVTFESSLNGETRTIAEDLVIPKVEQVGRIPSSKKRSRF